MKEMAKEEAIKYGTEWLKDEHLDAKDRVFIKLAIKALSGSKQGDLISRQALRNRYLHLDEVYEGMTENEIHDAELYGRFIADIEDAPSVEPKQGEWKHDGSKWENRFICTECGYKLFYEPTNYCPNCGAKMKGDNNE